MIRNDVSVALWQETAVPWIFSRENIHFDCESEDPVPFYTEHAIIGSSISRWGPGGGVSWPLVRQVFFMLDGVGDVMFLPLEEVFHSLDMYFPLLQSLGPAENRILHKKY